MNYNTGYFWIRVFDYVHERDSVKAGETPISLDDLQDDYVTRDRDEGKGVLLDEFYLKDITGGRDEAKKIVKEKYVGETASKIAFAKPRNKDGVYAIVMDSNKSFYDRFYVTIDTFCFWHECQKQIVGKASQFPSLYVGDKKWYEEGFDEVKDSRHFCSYECKRQATRSLNPLSEGEFQIKEEGRSGDIFGYIYLIYNRIENVYYIGQTRFMPFFRWQEHIKSGKKGDICDLSFSVLTEVARERGKSDEYNQSYLNSIEAWWIAKYQEENHKVMNITNPKITVQYLKDRFNEMVSKNQQLKMEL